MKKLDPVKVTSIEIKENKKFFYNILLKFIDYCEQNNFKKNSNVNLSYFIKLNKMGFVKKNIFIGILYLRGYVRAGKLLQNISTLKDNIEFRKNKIAYLFNKFIHRNKP